VLAASRPGAGALDAADLAWLSEADIASWSVYRDEVWALAAEFRAAGGRTACLSNSGPAVMARVREHWPLEARFDAVVISCAVGLSKPDSSRPTPRRAGRSGRQPGQFSSGHGGILPDAIIAEPT
jgi:hypothetical protein